MLKGMRFTFAFLLTAILVFVFSFLIGLSISESIFGAAIGTAPILLAVLYYGFGWTAREEKHELRAIQTESQLHEIREQLAELKAQNARLIALLGAPSDPKPSGPNAGTAPETPNPDQTQKKNQPNCRRAGNIGFQRGDSIFPACLAKKSSASCS